MQPRSKKRGALYRRLVLVAAIVALLPAAAAAGSNETYVARGGFDSYVQHPKTLSFSVDGDLIGEHLHWRRWGAARSTASGTIQERTGYPSYTTVRVPSSITLSAIRSCDGNRYYTHYSIHSSRKLPFRPLDTRLDTPCDGG